MKRIPYEVRFLVLYGIVLAGITGGVILDQWSTGTASFLTLGFVAVAVVYEMWTDHRKHRRQIADAQARQIGQPE